MSPAAATDLNDLLRWVRREYGLKQTLFWSGSMGGTSNLIYAALYPQDVNALVALGAATDIFSYYQWCREHHQEKQVLREIANAIETAYGKENALLRQHSALHNAGRLTMPIYLAHGAVDAIIPVEQARQFAKAMGAQKYFYYHEIPEGNHDAPLWDAGAWEFARNVLANW
jgi:pimeloyl-ACP methyl ester carboxylesterase